MSANKAATPATLPLEMARAALEAEKARIMEKYDRRIADLTRALEQLAGEAPPTSGEPAAPPPLKRGKQRKAT